MTDKRLPVVGAFVIGGLLLFAVGLFLIGDRRMLFSDTFEIYAEFSQIAALQSGATVRVGGMDAGEVETIQVPNAPSGKFRVKLRVREDLHQLLRLDSVATIQNDGLVGNKFVQIEAGTDASPPVPNQGTIQSREPFDLSTMLEKMNDTIDLIATTITDVKAGVETTLTALSATAADAQLLMKDLGGEVRTITASAHKVTEDLQVVIAGVRQGRGTFGKLMTDDALYTQARSIAEDAGRAIANLRSASEDARAAIADFRGDKGPIRSATGELQQTLASAREVIEDLSESSEALKRNFFFRGFFNRRGFFDLDTVTEQQYRQGALTTKDRQVLRVWVKSEFLFEKDATGRERLTDDGRSRIDSAMAPFLRYPRDTPLVVEGYAPGVTAADRYVASRVRAQLVREYVQGRYGLDPAYVGVMPLGVDAPESPENGRWDGIALAAFVQKTKMR